MENDALASAAEEVRSRAETMSLSRSSGATARSEAGKTREQAARDPGASEMTELEASLNRGLLVSLVQHKYPNPHVLN